MINYALKFYRISGAERSLFFRTYMLGLFYSFYVLLIPNRIIFKRLGVKGVESSTNLTEEKRVQVQILERIMRRVIRFSPWRISCFARAIIAKRVLKKRNIPSTIYFGISKDGNRKLTAHAWLRSGDIIVTGKEELIRFAPVLFFT
ncbi:MAG TPA: lasso peptide biosynthesis B2 protein [Bacteroidales bacterium]|nr:lasso peptide biosynthesis B2 protein [Bacteroidales bacterium]